MKEFVLLTGFILLFYLLGFLKLPAFCKKTQNRRSVTWMDQEYTTSIKGLAILTVIWAHGGAALGVEGIQFIAGIGVGLFLLCSGYGLEISYQKTGLKGFWKKRIQRIYIPVLLTEFLFEIIDNRLSFQQIFENGILLKASGWFLYYLLVCYFIFYVEKLALSGYLGKKGKKDSDKIEIYVLIVIFTIFLIVDLFVSRNAEIPFLRSRQMYCFPVGIIVAKKRKQIQELTTSYWVPGILTILGIGFMGITQLPRVANNSILLSIAYIPTMLFFVSAVLLFLKDRTKALDNVFLCITGIISYELFLVQQYTMQRVEISVRGVIRYLLITALIGSVMYILEKMIARVGKMNLKGKRGS